MNIEDAIQTKISLPEPKKAVLNLLFTHHIILEKMNLILKDYGISGSQYNVLRILRGQKGIAVNMNLIQERMIAKTSNTTRLVDKLLQKKLVTRNVCIDNRRKMEVQITAEGLLVLTQIDPLIDQCEQYFALNLNEIELKQLNILLEKYRNI